MGALKARKRNSAKLNPPNIYLRPILKKFRKKREGKGKALEENDIYWLIKVQLWK